MSPPPKKGSVSLLIGIGLLLAIISQTGAIKCYKCVAGECAKEPIPVEECTGGHDVCAYSNHPHPDYAGRVQQRYCTSFLADASSCHNFSDEKKTGRECTCGEDLCNTEKIWVPRDGREFAASAVPFATPLLVILGSFITLLIGGDLWN